MRFRQAKKILKMVAYNKFVGRRLHCCYKKAETTYMHHFRKGKKKVTRRTVMMFNMPVGV